MKPYYDDGKGIVIYHGDCRDVVPTLSPVDLVLTDPPYNAGKRYGPGTDDRQEWPSWVTWLDGAIDLWSAIAPETMLFLSQTAYRQYVRHSPRQIDWSAMWFKPLSMAVCAAPFMPHWEHIVYFGERKKGQRRHADGRFVKHKDGGLGSDVFVANVEHGKSRWGHPTPKPLALMREIVQRFGDARLILDPFMGSGTTLRAAKDLGRKAIGIEIEERYCEIAAKRLAQVVLPLTNDEAPVEAGRLAL